LKFIDLGIEVKSSTPWQPINPGNNWNWQSVEDVDCAVLSKESNTRGADKAYGAILIDFQNPYKGKFNVIELPFATTVPASAYAVVSPMVLASAS